MAIHMATHVYIETSNTKKASRNALPLARIHPGARQGRTHHELYLDSSRFCRQKTRGFRDYLRSTVDVARKKERTLRRAN
jgi:GrpB-like predicted nucleotidyltransferase (UPF0157 family)